MRSFATRSIRRWGTLPAAPSKSTRMGRALEGCFSYLKEYNATRRSLASVVTVGDWMSR